jgi:hypothetical protein
MGLILNKIKEKKEIQTKKKITSRKTKNSFFWIEKKNVGNLK